VFEPVVPLLDTEQDIGEPSFADEIEQLVKAAFFFEERLVTIVG
jgi:hypothetical protein